MTKQLTLSTYSGMIVTLSPKTDARVSAVSGSTVYTRSVKAARDLRAELKAWGVRDFVDVR